MILLDSVLQCIDPVERLVSLRRMAELIKPRGKLMIIFPTPPTMGREFQFEYPPEQFASDLRELNVSLPEHQRLHVAGEPSITQDMRGRTAANGQPVYYCKYLLEGAGKAKSISRQTGAESKPQR